MLTRERNVGVDLSAFQSNPRSCLVKLQCLFLFRDRLLGATAALRADVRGNMSILRSFGQSCDLTIH